MKRTLLVGATRTLNIGSRACNLAVTVAESHNDPIHALYPPCSASYFFICDTQHKMAGVADLYFFGYSPNKFSCTQRRTLLTLAQRETQCYAPFVLLSISYPKITK